jgi:glycosyltransferase involved in cell wall biosynthesis
LKLSIVIPVYNEEQFVQTIVARVVDAAIPAGMTRQIVMVNDCSKDGTAAKMDQIPALHPSVEFKIHHKTINEGKGAALRTAFSMADGDIILVQDADLEYDPADYMKLLGPIVAGEADVVYGSRFIGEPHRVMYYWHSVANWVLTTMSNMCTNLNLTDMEVCYKVFKTDVIRRITLKSNRFGFEPEVTAKISKLRPRLKIYEVGVAYHGRSYEEGKKITWKDGVSAVYCILRYQFFD